MQTRHPEVDAKREALDERLSRDEALATQLRARLELSALFHDNALEGIVFTQQDLVAAFDPTYIAQRGEAPMHVALRSQKAALDLVRAEAALPKPSPLPSFLSRLHGTLTGLGDLEPPSLRREVPTHRTYFHEILPPAKIEDALEALGRLTETAEMRELPPVDRSSTVHWHFMRIYPYNEHNGRIARLLGQLMLLREGFPLLIIHANDRQRYFEALSRPLPAFRTLLREAMEYSLVNALRFCEEARPTVRAVRSPVAARAKPAAKSKENRTVKGKAAPKAAAREKAPTSAKRKTAAERQAATASRAVKGRPERPARAKKAAATEPRRRRA